MQKALREVTEKTARTDEDARNIVKSTRELHQVITEVRQRLSCIDTELKDAKKGSENMQQALKELRESKNTADIKSVVSADLQQELADIGHRTSSFDNELKETRKDVEDMQKALREVTEKTARTDEDAKNIVKSTRELHQVITEVQQRLSCFDTELMDDKRGSEDMKQALREVEEQTARTDEDAKNIVKSTRELHQVITELRERLNCFDADMKDAREGSQHLGQVVAGVQQQTDGFLFELTGMKKSKEEMQEVFREAQGHAQRDLQVLKGSFETLQQALEDVSEMVTQREAETKSRERVTEELHQVVAEVQQQMGGLQSELTNMRKGTEDMQEVFRKAQEDAQRDLGVLRVSCEALQQALEDVSEKITQQEAETKSKDRGTESLHQVVAEVQQQVGSLQSELPNMRKGTEEMQEVFRKAQEDAERDLGVLRVSCEALQQALEDVSEKVAQKEEAESSERGMEALHQVVSCFQSELTSMRNGTEDMQAKLGASEGDLRELWNACQQCQEVSTASQQEIQALKEKLVELQVRPESCAEQHPTLNNAPRPMAPLLPAAVLRPKEAPSAWTAPPQRSAPRSYSASDQSQPSDGEVGRAIRRSVFKKCSAELLREWASQDSERSALHGSCSIPRQKLVQRHVMEQISNVYEVDEGVLGWGGFGTVRLARMKNARSVLRAIKKVSKRDLKAEHFVRGEIKVLRRLDHPCICRLLETYEDESAIYLVLEFIDGQDLFDQIMAGQLQGARSIARQIFSALRYCHERHVLHRDLKPDNIMVSQSRSSSPE
ncbi:unnamed protein product, partial [Durusdinium trenchii]